MSMKSLSCILQIQRIPGECSDLMRFCGSHQYDRPIVTGFRFTSASDIEASTFFIFFLFYFFVPFPYPAICAENYLPKFVEFVQKMLPNAEETRKTIDTS